MHEAVEALLSGSRDVDLPMWRSFWDELRDGGVDGREAVAFLASMATRLPADAALGDLLTSLDERRPEAPARLPDTVNIVGTGGGPRTFNISSAAAFVAAATGVRVVKSGSRSYASGIGSIDLLEQLGVRLTKSYADTEAALERCGIAFVGYFVYPAELTMLARRIFPMALRPFGRFLNSFGPFLARLPVEAQVVGVSDLSLLPALSHLAASVPDRIVSLGANDLGVDELLGFTNNTIYTNDGSVTILPQGHVTSGSGTLADVRPADPASVVEHITDLLAGNGGEVASQAVCLNAAWMAVAGGHTTDWAGAVAEAREALDRGAALDVLQRARSGSEPRAGMTSGGQR